MINELKIQQVRERIQNESIEHLQDVDYLEYKLLPELGFNDRHMSQYPQHLHQYCGRGLDSWQYPNQFSRYLVYLSSQNIKSYTEIGCHKGGTFIITVEYLQRFSNSQLIALAVDNWPRDIMKTYQDLTPGVTYLTDSSDSDVFRNNFGALSWDLTLIDGDHSYAGVKRDFATVANNSRRVAFHDIVNIRCAGVQQAWKEIKDSNPNQTHEWVDQYDDVLLRLRGSYMGIGIVELD